MKIKILNENFQTFVVYHGSQNNDLKFKDNYPLYMTDDKELAKDFAKGYVFGYNLSKEDVPTLYQVKLTLKNPYIIKNEEEYENLMDITNYNNVVPEMINKGYDGFIYHETDENLTYYTAFDPKNQVEIMSKELVENFEKEIIFNKDSYSSIIIGGEEYSDNDRECEIYYGIIYDNKHIGNVAIDNNTIEGFEIYPEFENQGLGRKTIKSLLKKHPEINFVESTPNAKDFWEKCGFKVNYYNEDSGLYNMYLSEKLIEKIVKIGNKWQVQSEKGRNMGTYDTKAEAEKRLQQVHYFKYANEDLDNNIIIINRNNINNYIKEYFDKYSDDELIKLSPAKVVDDFEGGTAAFLVTEQGQILKLDRIHADFCLQLFENVFENENITISYDMPEREVGYHTLNYFILNRNWCALNNNYYWLNTSSYINLPEKINYQQKVVIEEFIYYCSIHKKSIDINLKGLSRGTFEFVEYDPKDIMRLIQQLYYRDNKIEENSTKNPTNRKNINEEIINYNDTDIFTTESEYTAKNKLLSSDIVLRVYIDNKIPLYIIADADKIVHTDMVDTIKNLAGYEIKFDDYDKKQICLLFVPKTCTYFSEENDAVADYYDTAYEYDDFIIYSRYQNFRNFDLYKILGKPNNVRKIAI